jgi:hypothetical protein
MATHPEFPQFKPIELEDRGLLGDAIGKYQPETSEWTFSNLFIWRSHYDFHWCMLDNCLLVICKSPTGFCGYQPIGPSPRGKVMRRFLEYLKEERGEEDPHIARADKRLVEEIQTEADLRIEPVRDHFDYVYRTEDLIGLAGRKYHAKRNHLNKFRRNHSFDYASLRQEYIKPCLNLVEAWCEWRRCEEDMNLLDEWEAVREALNNFEQLKLRGGVILIEDKVEAFALGEPLNEQTAVVHIEKANPEIPELYAVINQQFCENSWQNVTYMNREQDLGVPGLRKAKLSYNPDHLVEKFKIRLVYRNRINLHNLN